MEHDETVPNEVALGETTGFSWRGALAGFFVSLIVYMILMSLGVAVGAGTIRNVIAGVDTARSIGIGAGVWTLLSVLISLFMGSYSSTRVSRALETRSGYIQGAVIASLVFIALLTQLGWGVSPMVRQIRFLAAALPGQNLFLVGNPVLRGTIEDAVGELKFKSADRRVVTGLANRLLRGDQESAVNYLSAQAGISRQEARPRVQALNIKAQMLAEGLELQGAEAARAIGWTAFATMFLGVLCAMMGGAVGTQVNARRPQVSRASRKAGLRPAYT